MAINKEKLNTIPKEIPGIEFISDVSSRNEKNPWYFQIYFKKNLIGTLYNDLIIAKHYKNDSPIKLEPKEMKKLGLNKERQLQLYTMLAKTIINPNNH